MLSTILPINSSHAVPNMPNKFIYHFDRNIEFTNKDTIAIENLTMYNSMFNITQLKGNNRFTLTWNADTITSYDIVMEDQYLDVAQLASFMKKTCIDLGLFLIDADGNALVYLDINTISNLYDIEFISKPLPTEAERISKGYSYPTNATWVCSTESKNMQITLGNQFGEILGLTAGTYPIVSSNINSSSRSTITPQVIKSNSILVGCNLVKNDMSEFSQILTGIPIDASFGGTISYIGASGSATNLTNITTNTLQITFYDQYFANLNMIDPNITLLLNLRKARVELK